MRPKSLPPLVATTKTWTSARPETRLDGIERLAWLLDNSIGIPGTRFRVGLDAVIGLIPGIGDLVGTLLSSYIVAVAASRGLPSSVLARMAINVGIEAIVGVVPIFGDLFDAAWKANQRNVRLLQQFRSAPVAARKQSRAVVAFWVIVVLAVMGALAWAAFSMIRWLVGELGAS
jgi:hypothetical protein